MPSYYDPNYDPRYASEVGCYSSRDQHSSRCIMHGPQALLGFPALLYLFAGRMGVDVV
ncbi:hypothetical protein P153DRAFT_369936 [Dothidotthia symphoricarpi CBS 119687]|uniref:Uncharacterized protein n=1 Tax=Dothidotthia symphoricarpi CBS 119687 TaxID=1392245 RepID=A0A6A6A276_9PLEO|nr:uncharacterized protein P153DRAFT_369936 [Dothidotthia symphoricarpi CBS 119687]KAF2125949.1 hypothetical protein P153DRAFT_369936 [Dothidotthia symphoricarpi CBS 119687]